ncbi:MAG: exonuclease SbcCD subunit D [Peptococcaceae bacterium]|nr:exonuclease SbcCD subunit D [Peptococcaceae bacterium]MDH7524580.1 exonuclease SbcCD subunit D [Peptococcaceae bacterium]
MSRVSFLHCADVHLGNLQYNEPRRLQDFAGAFRQVVDYALDSKVDFVLVSGDFFHKRSINAETLEQSVNLLSPLKEAGIPVFAIEGNHDKAYYVDKNSWLGFLNNQGYLNLLTPSFQGGELVLSPWNEETKSGSVYDLPGARVCGVGYLGVTTASRLEEILGQFPGKGDRFTVFMLHAAVNRLLVHELGGIKRELLEPFRPKVDYLALGHIHSRYELDGWIYNPGSLECVHLDEFGPGKEKGFYHVSAGDKGVEAVYVPSRCRPVCRYSVDISASREARDVCELLWREISPQAPAEGAQVQVTLYGQVPYSPLGLDLEFLAARLKETYSCLHVEILNRINLPVEEKLAEGSTVKREDVERLVFRQVLAQERNWEEGDLAGAVEAVRRVKEMALAGEDSEEIIKFLLESSSALLGDDATGQERGENGGEAGEN